MTKYLKLILLFKNIVDEKEGNAKFYEHQRFWGAVFAFISAVFVVQFGVPGLTEGQQAELTTATTQAVPLVKQLIPIMGIIYGILQGLVGQIKAQKRKKDAAS